VKKVKSNNNVRFELFVEEEEASRTKNTNVPASNNKQPLEQPDELIGHVFKKRYRADQKIGDGSFGKVYLVFDEKKSLKYY
jgi:hypothetical protein